MVVILAVTVVVTEMEVKLILELELIGPFAQLSFCICDFMTSLLTGRAGGRGGRSGGYDR